MLSDAVAILLLVVLWTVCFTYVVHLVLRSSKKKTDKETYGEGGSFLANEPEPSQSSRFFISEIYASKSLPAMSGPSCSAGSNTKPISDNAFDRLSINPHQQRFVGPIDNAIVIVTDKPHEINPDFDVYPNEYPPDWHLRATACRERDGHRCQVTGCPSLCLLDVHHILPISRGGNHSSENLVTLCRYHHGILHLEQDLNNGVLEGTTNERFHLRRASIDINGIHRRACVVRRAWVTAEDLRETRCNFELSCPRCLSPDWIGFMPRNPSTKSCIRVICNQCKWSANSIIPGIAEKTCVELASIMYVPTHRKGRFVWDDQSDQYQIDSDLEES